jgi:hypothetical protein
MQRITSLKLFDKHLVKEAKGKRAEVPCDIETHNSFFEKRRKADRILYNANQQPILNDKLRIK